MLVRVDNPDKARLGTQDTGQRHYDYSNTTLTCIYQMVFARCT